MSEDSLDIFDALEELGNFELALGGLVERLDFVEQMANNAAIQESKLILTISSVEGIPCKKGFMKNASLTYSLQVEMGLDKYKRKLFSGANQTIQSVKDESPLLFEIVDFFALSKMKFTLKCKNMMTGVKKVVGEHSIRLMDLLNHQNKYDEDRTKLSLEEYVHHNCYVNNHLMMETTLICQDSMDHYSATNWLETAKSAAIAQSSRSGSSKGKHSVLHGYQEAIVVVQKARVKINFKFRLLSLQKCVQLTASFKNANDGIHSISDFHSFLACSRSNEVIEVMKSLAAKHVLAPALRKQSSEGITPLDFVLLSGNAEVVTVILQRAGNLCFRGILPHKKCCFHYAIMGGSKVCLDILIRFFTRYSNREPINRTQPHWSPLLSELIDWRDENSDTPLLLACKLNKSELISSLLMAGADIASINQRTKYTPLMYAASIGSTEIVQILLCILKSDSEIEDTIHAVALVGSSSNITDNALARHLRTNARSRNMLRGSNLSTGGYFNNLCLYNSLPSHFEDSDNRQAIHIAALNGHIDVIRLLLSIGVSCGVTDRHGNNIFHLLATLKGKSLDISQLINQEAKQWSAFKALHSDVILQTMQSRRRSLCVANFRGKTPIDIAIENGNYELSKKLLRALDVTYPELFTVNNELKSKIDLSIQCVDKIIAANVSIRQYYRSVPSAPATTSEVAASDNKTSSHVSSDTKVNDIQSTRSTGFQLTNRANSLELTKSRGPPVAAASTGDAEHKYEPVNIIEEKEDDLSPPSRPMSGNYSASTLSNHSNNSSGYMQLVDNRVGASTTASITTTSVTTSLIEGSLKIECSENKQIVVNDRLSELKNSLDNQQRELLVVLQAIDHIANSRVKTMAHNNNSVVVAEDSNEQFDDEADDLAYEFALSALTKKTLERSVGPVGETVVESKETTETEHKSSE